MFYDVLMEKRAEREEKKKKSLPAYQLAALGAVGGIGAGKGLVHLVENSDRVKDFISRKEYYEQLAKMSPLEQNKYRAHGRALHGSVAGGALLSAYLGNKYLSPEE